MPFTLKEAVPLLQVLGDIKEREEEKELLRKELKRKGQQLTFGELAGFTKVPSWKMEAHIPEREDIKEIDIGEFKIPGMRGRYISKGGELPEDLAVLGKAIVKQKQSDFMRKIKKEGLIPEAVTPTGVKFGLPEEPKKPTLLQLYQRAQSDATKRLQSIYGYGLEEPEKYYPEVERRFKELAIKFGVEIPTTVMVTSPDGQLGEIPKEDLKEALLQGYELAQ